MTAVAVLACLAVAVVALAYTENSRNELERERIRRQEADAWAEYFEKETETLRCENVRLRDQVATLQMLYAERTGDLLAHNYRIIETNVAWKRRRQQ